MYIPVNACICVYMNAGTNVQTHYVMYHNQKNFNLRKKTFVVFNQEHASTWFLKISLLGICPCVYTPSLLITSGIMYPDIHPIQLAEQILQLLYDSYIWYCL